MTMPSSERALGFVACIFVPSFDDELDEDNDDVLPPPLTLLLILRMFSAVEFLTFFGLFLLIIYANLGGSFTDHRRTCRSRENGEGSHQIRVLTQVGVAEKKREIRNVNLPVNLHK